jgi:hypothetical protein
MARRAARRMITYPTNRLIGVIDTPAGAAAAAAALAAAGFPGDGVVVLLGDEGRDRLGRLGASPNVLSRIVRFFQFVLMDQTPDFIAYEAAIAEGRAVIAVTVDGGDRARMLRAAAVLEGSGAHFLNFFGRFQTEEVSLWRGAEPAIPDALRR